MASHDLILPESCCVFGDNVRRMKMLQSVNAAFERQGFKEDVRLISQASAADFMQANESQDVISNGKLQKTCRRVQLALRQLTFFNKYGLADRRI